MTAVNIACLLVGLGFLAWASTFGVWGLLNDHSTPTKTPVGGFPSPRIEPPTGSQAAGHSPDPRPGSVRRRPTVPLSDPSDLSGTVAQGWRLR
ncbi:hypothetical protein [Lentzea nigeriaca]|uniref:hypothetical protein n=1 Tax=Lentzea nigeriaca TaxID=1128665 RepID=UPI00195738F3|nr:hypothetical protein [Lentzea nigeriaca]MBM7860412.1 hypothetical protein [Lentzea nigeriaca]